MAAIESDQQIVPAKYVKHSGREHMKQVFAKDRVLAAYDDRLRASCGKLQAKLTEIKGEENRLSKVQDEHMIQRNKKRYAFEQEYAVMCEDQGWREQPFVEVINKLAEEAQSLQREVARFRIKKSKRKRVLEKQEMSKSFTRIGKAIGLPRKHRKIKK